jgi:two-component system, chemotaxis family, sensor kinase CheA
VADAGSVREGRALGAAGSEAATSSAGRAEPLLVLRVGDDRRVGVPLGQVERLEELDASRVEHAGSRSALQYRGELLPLVWLSEVLGVPASAGAGGGLGTLPIVVCSDGRRSVGLVAEQILDVVEEVVSLSDIGTAHGVLGTAVVQGRATDFLDLAVAASYAGVVFSKTVDLALGGALDGDDENVPEEVSADAR